MRELLGDIELSLDQAASIARAMLKVAQADGVHAREREMIDGFYQSCAEEVGREPGDLEAEAFSPDVARQQLSSRAHQEALVKSCYLLSLADGSLSPAEGAAIEEIADGLGISAEDRERWARDAKVFLLQQFEGVTLFQDEALRIGRELGFSDDEVRQILRLPAS